MITTVVFDLDDTLYDEADYCKSGLSATADFLAALDSSPPAEQIFNAFWHQFTSGDRTRIFNTALEELDIPARPDKEELIAELINIYRNHVPDIKLPTESKTVLDQLSGEYILAMITDGFLPGQEYKVQALGIESYFKSIIYTDKFGREFWKPSPVGFEKLMKILKQPPENMVYVGDNEKKDFVTSNKMGFTTIQLIRPARIHTGTIDDPDAPAKYVISKITELPSLLKTL